MYQTPNRHRVGGGGSSKTNSHSPSSKVPTLISDGPIPELCTIIEHTPSDDWLKRITAFEVVIEQIPALGSTYLHHPAWYNTPKVLLHLSLPIQELIKDPRSTVVRRVCVALTTLFQRCQSDARLLFKDIMHTVLIVQGQTVQTIRNAVTTMIVDAIPQVPCKSVMPFWMERLKDKSPTIRDACSLYLGIALQSWSSLEQEQYLTDEIWYQVGTALMKTLRDPSPNVRQQTKTTLMYMQEQYPHRWETLIHDPNGPAAKDAKLLQWLTSLSGMSHNGNGDDTMPDDLSLASKYTYNSESRFAAAGTTTTTNRNVTTMNNPIRISSPRLLKLQTHRIMNSKDVDDASSMGGRSALLSQSQPPTSSQRSAIPFSIAVTTTTTTVPSNHRSSHLQSKPQVVPPPDPPETKGSLRRTNDSTMNTNHLTSTPGRTTMGTPPRPKAGAAVLYNNNNNKAPSTPQAQTYSALALQASQDEEDDDNNEVMIQESNVDDTNLEYSESQNSTSSHHMDASTAPVVVSSLLPDSPFIASMHELKKHASQRRSRNSMVMQERFKQQQLQQSLTPTSSRDSTTVETHKSEMENQPRHGNQEKDVETKASSKVTSSSISTTPVTATTPKPKVADGTSTTSSSSNNNTPQPPPEHIVIAIRLLRAHKSHVDQIMETLKLEMDTLRDFDRLLELAGRPTEEELITYYESIDLCLQQRYNANMTLRNEMNELSTGNSGTE